MCLLCCISELAVITAFLFIFEMFGLIVYSCVISDFSSHRELIDLR